ncbi:ferredoxin-type protein NapF [Franconibacter helveticus]|uniref:ferredoxin-type protein NapF n=1 Tax=Franconibacter helveticus TaxID=357240 RepID=UPI002911B2D6|nr:ferredoxin-type protein NapF [Franconibacter helveticus]MDU6925985.1 ferredoxin-type protein NapF [Franconibacter helveticus]
MVEMSRRGLLTGRKALAIRPPWSGAESHFIELCSRCGACLDACETGVLRTGEGGFPQIDFTRAGCTFCYACADACPQPIFAEQRAVPWRLKLALDAHCLALQRVECRCCQDACDTRAIRFSPLATGVAIPHIAPEHCTTCGECLRACPVSALRLERTDER